MKLLIKYTIYAVIIIAVVIACMTIFKDHLEAQFAFIFPGIFLVAFSEILDDTFRRASSRVRTERNKS